MEAPPKGMSANDFVEFVRAYVAEHYEQKDGEYVCKKDGAVIQQTTGVASIHFTEFKDACAGGGSVKRFPLPYCPVCEGKPREANTCVHVPMHNEDLALAELTA